MTIRKSQIYMRFAPWRYREHTRSSNFATGEINLLFPTIYREYKKNIIFG
nr:MAG TPA: hypothetical protein [Caudoviricetes sp.]